LIYPPTAATVRGKKGVNVMQNTSLKPVIEKLEALFSNLNNRFYNGDLQRPVITVSPDTTKGAFGWCTSWKAWGIAKEGEQKDDEGYFEINICAEYLSRPFEQVAETLLHEMVHLYNLQIGVQDTSRSGTYHNKKFKEAAEQHGLIAESSGKYGYSSTKLNEEAAQFISQYSEKKFELFRKPVPKIKGKSSKQSSRKYVCPGCGLIIRATKEVHVICADCELEFVEEE